ncbi:MAG: biopolymer transporter ExbD [Nitrospirae bacterium]|nr:biopolymer transporter ExbD [Nitrospirota bacterium]
MKSASPHINVTPLVDVVLVLLIIFMVVIPRMIDQIPIDLPGVFNPDPKYEQKHEPVTITIAADKQLYIGEQSYSGVEAIENELALIRQETPDRQVLVKADTSLQFKHVRPVLDILQKLGFRGTGFVVGAKNKEEG